MHLKYVNRMEYYQIIKIISVWFPADAGKHLCEMFM